MWKLNLFTFMWIAATSGGFLLHTIYIHQPDPHVHARPRMPVESQLVVLSNRGRALMFIHPRCGCTQAGLERFAALAEEFSPQIDFYAVFWCPPEFADELQANAFWKFAGRTPQLIRVIDHEGVETKRFGAANSGTVLLYDDRGSLRFQGGLSAARGHSVSEDRVQLLQTVLNSTAPETVHCTTFGCPFDNP